ncbi:MAG TPA: site-specific integrase, partial [Ktedonobacteraceae bacterium]|nr:site-specific integrase [Ktedonobacteraceae bacterium]
MSVFHLPGRIPISRDSRHQRRVQVVTDTSVRTQRAKHGTQMQEEKVSQQSKRKKTHEDGLEETYIPISIVDAIDVYLQDHEGGNHSPKTLEWHATALGLLRRYLEEERAMTQINEIDATDISAWFTFLRAVPGRRGKLRSERTIQTYARSARAFFRWLMRREMLDRNPFDQVVFPKVGRPLIQTIEPEEFEQLLQACALPHESGWLAERAVARNRAILWLFYDTGIRVSELINVRLD